MKTTKWIVSSSLMALTAFAWASAASSPVAKPEKPAMAQDMQQMHAQMQHQMTACEAQMKSNTGMHASASAAH